MIGVGVSRRWGVLAAAVTVAAMLVVPSVAAAETVTKKVGATIVIKNLANPKAPGNCGVTVILEWKDPKIAGFEPTNWVGHYFYGPASARTEQTVSGTPPFNNAYELAGNPIAATGGANWLEIGFGSRAGAPSPGVPLDCSDLAAKSKETLGTQAWVMVTGTQDGSSTAECLAARKSYSSAQEKVNGLRRALRAAKTDAAKDTIRTRLNTATRQRTQAAARSGKACSG